MENPSKALKVHLLKSAENGLPLAILFAQIALFIATLFVQKTRLYEKYDSIGVETGLSYQIVSAGLVSNSRCLSRLGFIHRRCGSKVNSIANLICLILAIVLEKFYEKSLSSLGFALSITVLFLILLVIIQPSTDLGLFSFLIGVIGSVAYNLFGLKFQTWIVVAICFPLLGFRCWLEKNWLEEGEDQSLPTDRSTGGRNQISKLEIVEAVTVAGFHLFLVYNLCRTNCRKIKGPPKSISCTSSSIMGMLACGLIFNLWFGLALIPRIYSLFQTQTTELYRRRIIVEQVQGPVERITRVEAQGVFKLAGPSLEPAKLPRRRMPVSPLPPVLKKVEKEARKKEDRPAYKAA